MTALDQNGNPLVFGAAPRIKPSLIWAATARTATTPRFGEQIFTSTAVTNVTGSKKRSLPIGSTALPSSIEPPTKRVKFNIKDYGDLITILGGKNKLKVVIMRKLACAEFYLLKAKLEEDSESGGKEEVVIVGHTSMAASMYANWLMNGDVESLQNYTAIRTGSQLKAAVVAELECQWAILADCFQLGEDLVAPRFKNNIMDAIVSKSKEIHQHDGAAGLRSKQLNTVYNGTNNDSPLRRLVLHTLFVSNAEKIIDELYTSMPMIQQFLKDVAKLSVARLQNNSSTEIPITSANPWDKHPCEYHDHSEQEEGYCCT
ncbi:hypothetical protein ONS95_000180 [Cadophora gregata]|uniref:uncharacterized protein n=1 Tax=Cadophora gregata TaxID=51156 RepID=UPI0026DD4B0D|nr:uncharacterized protein ONS95_000180 [Cadophora gregata]KAK0115543.1 hypothetical protein ONS96_013996 [Cadophora gregata f. sp. sojae]KAK0128202.1 hypothetical protein ONS95_000180 [Cadophora gregata]